MSWLHAARLVFLALLLVALAALAFAARSGE
jgi:hypothetical protein